MSKENHTWKQAVAAAEKIKEDCHPFFSFVAIVNTPDTTKSDGEDPLHIVCTLPPDKAINMLEMIIDTMRVQTPTVTKEPNPS